MWENRCLKATHTEFQRVFEEAMQLLEGNRFTPVKPHGREGDWKADGILDDGRVIFQVYSPNEPTVADVKAKIARDLPGAVDHWEQEIEEWVFVYNRRTARGLAPQILGELREYRGKYPALELSMMNDGDLWDRLRKEISATRRAELLGLGMADWEGTFVPPSENPSEYTDDLARSRIVILHPFDRPIDPTEVMRALEPERPFGPPYHLEPDLSHGWAEAAAVQRQEIDELVARAGERLARFAVFSQAPIPLGIHLGAVLSDRVDAELYQYDRDRSTWAWDPEASSDGADTELRIEGLPDEKDPTVTDVCVRFSLSAHVSDRDVEGAQPEGAATIRIEVEDPDVMWLRHPGQLQALERQCRKVWKIIRAMYPTTERIHSFYAGPAPGAMVLGRSYNPRMNPPLWLYQYDRGRSPRYRHVLTLSS